ncbi:MAG: family 43 glycosylhydrolase, partial [Lewinella sp.]
FTYSGRLCPVDNSRAWLRKCWLVLTLIASFSLAGYGQAPSHDPSTMVRNNDGRYWIFTTGDGVWAMSSSNREFTDWRPEPTPFAPGTYPGWINNYVDGFRGFFWAPDVIKIGGTYFLYYSAAGNGAPAAIGVATATDLRGPWTDRGMVVAGNNAIDPAMYMDNGRLWMSWGNWQSGIDITELSPTTGKRISGITDIVNGQVEGPGLIRNGNYYYVFYQRGLCCQGLSSGYTMMVARSTSITGPYTGERVFLANRSGNQHGPGHFGYGEDRLTYHYYAVNENGAAKLAVTTLGWRNGWPVAGVTGGWSTGGGTVYQLRNRGTGLYLDGYGRTTNGDAVAQYANTTHPNSQWTFVDAGGGYTQLRNVGTGLFLDGMGRTANGSEIGQWANTTHPNSQWSIQSFDGIYQRIQNRGTGLYLDGYGRTTNGEAVAQYANTSHPNAQWQLVPVNQSGLARTTDLAAIPTLDRVGSSVGLFPNPATDVLNLIADPEDRLTAIKVYSTSGQLVLHRKADDIRRVDVAELVPGVYLLETQAPSGQQRLRFVKQ